MQPLTPEEQRDLKQFWEQVRTLARDSSQPEIALLARAAVLNAEAVERLRDLLDGHFRPLAE
jgi:hypothetical protein